jgi:hypothetical protein
MRGGEREVSEQVSTGRGLRWRTGSGDERWRRLRMLFINKILACQLASL